MAKQDHKKFGWEIKNFSSLQSERFCSTLVHIGDCKWRLVAYYGDYLSLYLEAAGLESLPYGWRRYAEYRLTIVNRLSETHSVHRGGGHWFDKNSPRSGFLDMISMFNLTAIHGGFLVNGVLMIIAQVVALEVISTLNASQVEEISNDYEWGPHDSSSSSKDLQNKEDVTVEVNGFQVLDSQVNHVKAIFEKHPDLTWNFKLTNQQIKNAYMYVLLDLIKTLCKSPVELIQEDLSRADNTLTDLINAGLNLGWLRQKLDEALEKQIAYDTRIRELKNQVKKRKLALAELEGNLEKEEAAATAALMLFDYLG